EAAAGDDVEAVLGEARDGEVAFDAAPLVAELGIDDAADRPVHARGSQSVDGGKGAGACELELAEGALVDEGDALAHGAMLGGDGREPVGAMEGGAVHALHSGGCEPVRPLPARLGAMDRAFLLQQVVERAAADAARALMLQPRIVDLIVLA